MATKNPITGEDLRPRATKRGLELLPVVAKALMTHASLDETRVAITGLGIDGSGDAAWLCATDGCRAVRMPIRGTVPEGVSGVIPASEVKASILRAEAGDVTGRGTEGATLIVIPWCKPTSWSFPPIAQVVPRDTGRGKADAVIPEVDPEYLMDAAKLAHTFQRAVRLGPSLTIALGHMSGELDPVRYDVNYRGEIVAQIVIMPMRVTKGAIPKTHEYKPTPPVEWTEERVDAPVDPAVARAEGDPVDDRPIGKRTRAPRKPRAPKVAKGDSETAHIRAEAA